ncbi:MAG: hypothetical protein KDC38_20680, partial [Planctomycetes bacterium]|nr:hypothetical protein [Planctomycetota bacterium]
MHGSNRSTPRWRSPDSPLHAAAIRGDISEVARRLDAGEPVDARFSIAPEHGSVYQQWTPLMFAGFAGAAAASMIRLLLERGADPHATSEARIPVVHYIALGGRAEALKLLIDLGAAVAHG